MSLLSKEEACRELGISYRTLQRAMSRKEIAYERRIVGSKIIITFESEEVQRFKATKYDKEEIVYFPAIEKALLDTGLDFTADEIEIIKLVLAIFIKLGFNLNNLPPEFMSDIEPQKTIESSSSKAEPNINQLKQKLTLTPKEAALITGFPPSRILQDVKQGLLAGVKVGGKWRILTLKLDSYINYYFE